jgi:hypothetical protein
VTGATQSHDFPVSSNAYQPAFSGDSTRVPNGALDAFIAHFRSSGENVYTTYFGSIDQRELGVAAAGAATAL